MNESIAKTLWMAGAAAVALATLAAAPMGGSVMLGVLAGAAWNLASLWCLTRMMGAWLGPNGSTKRAAGWILVKFPLLYLLAFAMLRSSISIIGFGIGFSVVLLVSVAWFVLNAQKLMAVRSDGR